MQAAGLKNRLPKTLHMSDILRDRFCFWHAGSSAPSQATCITKHTLLHLIWVCIHRCLSTSICRYVCVTSCHAFASVRFDSIPELLPGASLQLRVESSTSYIYIHIKYAHVKNVDTRWYMNVMICCVTLYCLLCIYICIYLYLSTEPCSVERVGDFAREAILHQ